MVLLAICCSLFASRSRDNIRLHREIFGQAEAVEDRCRFHVARFDTLPELTIVESGEGRRVFLRLVLEDRLDLELQLILRQRHEPGRFGDRPLLPRATVQPDLRTRRETGQRAIDRFLAHAMRAVRIRQIAGHEDQVGTTLVQQLPDDSNVVVADRVFADLAGAVERQVEKPCLAVRETDGLEAAYGFCFADGSLDVEDFRGIDITRPLRGRNSSTRWRNASAVVSSTSLTDDTRTSQSR